MKKTILLITFLLVLSTLVIAGRNALVTSDTHPSTGVESWVVQIEAAKGWNLLPEGGVSSMDFEGSTDLSNVLFPMYFYMPVSKTYAESEGGYDSSNFALVQQNSEYLKLGARWYYFTEDTPVFLKVDKIELKEAKLYAGWNLMSYAPQMFFNELDAGDCVIEKLYYWNPFLNNWDLTDQDMLFGEDPEDDLVGYGFAIKVQNTCTLQKTVESIPSVPEIPQ